MTGFEPANSAWKADMFPLTSHLRRSKEVPVSYASYYILMFPIMGVIRAGIEPSSTALKGQCRIL